MRHRFDASNAECFVFTFKEGLLSMVAHDLQIRVTDFDIDVDDEKRSVEARFSPDSLRVVGAMRDGQLDTKQLTSGNREEIESNIVQYVLQPARFPEIRFASTAVEEKRGTFLIRGVLTLHGRDRRIKVAVQRQEKAYTAECTLHQPDFGITPYSALLGTLRISPEVKVQVRVPAP